MSIRQNLVVLALVAWCPMMLNGVETREYPCYRLPTPPVLDGKLDEAAWQTLPESTGFLIIGGKDYAVEKQTFFRAGWTADSVYLAIKCVEPLTSKMNASTADGDSIWSDDALELFFAPAGANRYFQLIANSVGTRWNAIGPDVKDTKPWAWEARPGKWEQGWQLEIRIPFAVLEKTPQAGEQWPASIARDITTGPATELYTCWPPLQKGFNDVERFGRFIFKPGTLSARAAAKKSHKLNEPFFAYLRTQCREKSKITDNAELLAALNNPGLAQEAAPLKSVMADLAKIGERKDADPWELAVLLSTHRNLLTIFSEKAAQLDIPLKKVPKTMLTFDVKARNAKEVKMFVNGQVVKEQDNKLTAAIREGLSAIGITATADGKAPGLRLGIPRQPELGSRWRVGVATNDNWLTADFDDRSWKKAELDNQGYLRFPEGSAGKVCFRQLVLWGENHYSGLPCLQPKVREWGFSEKSMETFFHVLYSPPPLTFALEDYEFVLDVPKGFNLLDEKYTDDSKGSRLNRRPQKVTVEAVQHDNQPYTRYRFAFEPAFVQTNKTQCALIPLVLNEFKGADKTCRFYFRRMASGNLTELEQTLPVRVLPPLNGRMPKKVLISQYISTPWIIFAAGGGGWLFPEHFNAHIRQSLDVGFNCWFIGAWEGEYGKKVYDRVIERGGVVVLNYNNYPIHGNNLGTNSALGQWMQKAPETRARFFNGTSDWTKEGQYCPSFVTGAGAAQFKEAVKKDIGAMLHGGPGSGYIGLPKSSIYFTDWEEVPWIEAGMGYVAARTGDGSYCFCERCKQAFRAYAKLPETEDLSDGSIWKKYKLDWNSFRYELDGRINGIVREACNELGLKYMFYTGAHDKECYMACKDKIDIAFPGSPGGDGCYSDSQQYLDDYMTFFREKMGMWRIHGQQFAVNPAGQTSHPWDNWTSRVKDGFFIPKMVKLQILRIVASYHGGLDLNTSIERCAGMHYYIGEATRIISEYEDLFWDGERADDLAASGQIKYPNLLVLRKGDERLVLLFNEGAQPLTARLQNKDVKPGQKGTIYGTAVTTDTPQKMEVTIAPEDVVVVHIK